MRMIEGAGYLCAVTHRDAVNEYVAAHLDSNAGASRCIERESQRQFA